MSCSLTTFLFLAHFLFQTPNYKSRKLTSVQRTLTYNPSSDPDVLFDSDNSTLRVIYEHHAPSRKETITTRCLVPWFNKSIRNVKQARRKAEQDWRHSRHPDDLSHFHQKRNLTTSLMNHESREYYSEFINQNSHDKRKLFTYAKELLGMHQQDLLPPNSTSGTLSQDFADFFTMKVVNIRPKIDSVHPQSSTPFLDPVESTPYLLTKFSELSDQDINSMIMSTSNKTCEADPIPSKLIKSCTHILAPVLKKPINLSLLTGHFCSLWKRAIIRPKLKNNSLDPIIPNYRPLSNLSLVSKLVEKASAAQVISHLTTQNLFPTTQSAYRQHHSTETALLWVKNDILLNMNRQHVTLLVLLDLSAAFDTVDHTILLIFFALASASLEQLLYGLNPIFL